MNFLVQSFSKLLKGANTVSTAGNVHVILNNIHKKIYSYSIIGFPYNVLMYDTVCILMSIHNIQSNIIQRDVVMML
jgi:hypothetical protein